MDEFNLESIVDTMEDYMLTADEFRDDGYDLWEEETASAVLGEVDCLLNQ